MSADLSHLAPIPPGPIPSHLAPSGHSVEPDGPGRERHWVDEPPTLPAEPAAAPSERDEPGEDDGWVPV